jgi:hypothetical protein
MTPHFFSQFVKQRPSRHVKKISEQTQLLICKNVSTISKHNGLLELASNYCPHEISAKAQLAAIARRTGCGTAQIAHVKQTLFSAWAMEEIGQGPSRRELA